MDKLWTTKFGFTRRIFDALQQNAYVFHTHTNAIHGYDEYIYVLIAKSRKKDREVFGWDGLYGAKVVTDGGDETLYTGHCFRIKFVQGVATTNTVYYGSIEQPCTDLSCVVALDPHDLPTTWTTDADNVVTYDFEYDSSVGGGRFRWDSGVWVNTAANALSNLDGNTAAAGAIYVFRDRDPCFDINNGDDPVSLGVYVLGL